MDDLISRQTAIDEIDEWIKAFLEQGHKESAADVRLIQDGIIQLPSAQPEQEWIPCSEKLPENGHYYLWCSDMGSVQSDYYWNGFENGKKYGYNIVAWQSLPEPYRGEQE